MGPFKGPDIQVKHKNLSPNERALKDFING